MKRLLADVRALGYWTPVRALYEVTSKLGITGRVLQWRARRLDTPRLESPFPARPVPGTERGWADLAERIETDGIDVFGRRVRLGDDPDWHTDGAGHTWPRREWWRIDLRPGDGRDVKHVWEIARHRHLIVLARAAVEEPAASHHVDTINRHLQSWLVQNPPEIGIHWLSNLELAVRALAWLEVIHLVGDRLDERVRAGMAAYLYHSGRHIVAELPYTVSSMRNNHLVGDAVGLVAVGKAFPSDRNAARWVRLGDRLLRWHVPRHVAPDGSSLEDSLGYRGFVLELLSARAALGEAPTEVIMALRLARRHLSRVGVGSGPAPHFGDWDGGTAMLGHPRRLLPESSVEVAGIVLGEEVADPAVADGSDGGGGMGRVERGPWTAWLKAGAGESHEHADLTSVTIRSGHYWVVGDPGNGSYNRSMAERDYFRTSVAHSVLRIDGQDQRVPHRRFRWRHHPGGKLGLPFDLGDYRVMWGSHDAYERLEPPRGVVRACSVSERAVVVADWIVGGGAEWELSLPLGPELRVESPESRVQTETAAPPYADGTQESRVESRESRVRLPDGSELGVLLPGPAISVRGSTDPYDGWWADDYDVVRPATRLEMKGRGAGPIVWAIWTGDAPDVAVEDGVLRIDGGELRIAVGPDGDPDLIGGAR